MCHQRSLASTGHKDIKWMKETMGAVHKVGNTTLDRMLHLEQVSMFSRCSTLDGQSDPVQSSTPSWALLSLLVLDTLLLLLLGLFRQQLRNAVEGVFEARLIDGLQPAFAGADARALMLIVAQAHIVLVGLHMWSSF
jgi:hypothetical protein